MMSALYTGTTGMKSHSVGMSSIANNIANINTLGFKKAMTMYSDNISQTVSSASANGITEISQMGMGVSVLTNRTMHQQGSFEQGSAPTDMAIQGKGFFGVTKNGATQYTRAGNFRFTKEGTLIDPNEFALLGYQVTNGQTSNELTPVSLDFSQGGQGYMQPKATASVTLIENLGTRTQNTRNSSNPVFSLTSAWDGKQAPPLSESQYAHKTAATIYDASGNPQALNAFYDYVGTFDGKQVFQYVMGMDPSLDASGNAGTSAAGMLAAGTLTFSSTGQLEDVTMFTPPTGGDASNMASWVPASFDEAGNPAFSANFSGSGAQNIALNFGLEMNGTWTKGFANAAAINADPTALYNGPARTPHADSTKSYSGSNATRMSNQDGHAAGFLEDLSVQSDGLVVGRYSNGETMDLYQIPVYRFINEEGLRHEGGNRYTATVESGDAEVGMAGTENYGTLQEAALEQSNVDLANEFAFMITTQRGFQMNSKIITTSDTMLQKALELKR